MKLIEKSRILRPLSRKESSPYKVNVEKVGASDILRLTVFSEENQECVLGVFEFSGQDLSDRKSIHFSATNVEGKWELRFSGARPVAVTIG